MSDVSRYRPISDYGLIGDMHTCALVSTTGSIDFCCLPAFDSPTTFGRMLDWRRGGHFQIVAGDVQSISRRYLPGTNVLETTFRTATGVATLTDFMPVHATSHSRVVLGAAGLENSLDLPLRHPRNHKIGSAAGHPVEVVDEPFEVNFEEKIIRIFKCESGYVDYILECFPRFDYGTIMPRVMLDKANQQHGLAHGGASALLLYVSEPLTLTGGGFTCRGRLESGKRLSAMVTSLSHYAPSFSVGREWTSPEQIDALLSRSVKFWQTWSSQCTFRDDSGDGLRDQLLRSALILKALTYDPSGALVAAATTGLPEGLGGERNWDYRFTWIRDATFSLAALSDLGFAEESQGFKNWIEWTVAYPEDLQLMYGIRGERNLAERELPLEGYCWSRPVRVGNGAASQFQLDIYGEFLDSAYMHRQVTGRPVDPDYWGLLSDVTEFTIKNWRRPDAGIWESRGGDRHFVYSKVMCWVALDRAVKLAADSPHLTSDLGRWEAAREEIREDILACGFDTTLGAFVQSYGSRILDASALRLPLVGFIDPNDPRMRSTVAAIERDLTSPAGLVYRYKGFDDGLSGAEGSFVICSYWLVQNQILQGDLHKARSLFQTLRRFANDLGLFSEEVDAETGELLGNFPQAFSHLSFVQTALMLVKAEQHGDAVEQKVGSASSTPTR